MNENPDVVLGIDAAWTEKGASGVALLRRDERGRWRCVAITPSYASFLSLPDKCVNWRDTKQAGSEPEIPALLRQAEKLAGAPVNLVALDLPMSRSGISGRRYCDNQVARELIGTHSPSAARPGPISKQYFSELRTLGFVIATNSEAVSENGVAIEVYPHASLIRLMRRRPHNPIRYKHGRTTRYWPGKSLSDRKKKLRKQYDKILGRLAGVVSDVRENIDCDKDMPTLTSFKPYEDALDALICAWTGTRYLAGQAEAYGDSEAVIWIPSHVIN